MASPRKQIRQGILVSNLRSTQLQLKYLKARADDGGMILQHVLSFPALVLVFLSLHIVESLDGCAPPGLDLFLREGHVHRAQSQGPHLLQNDDGDPTSKRIYVPN